MYHRDLGVGQPGTYPHVEAWLARCKKTLSYQRAVDKTGFTLDGNYRQR